MKHPNSQEKELYGILLISLEEKQILHCSRLESDVAAPSVCVVLLLLIYW